MTEPQGATSRQMDELTQKIAYKLASDYGLKESDFAIKFWWSKRFDYVIKAGGVIRVYFTHTPKYPDYEVMLRRCLQQVSIVKRSKNTSIVVYGAQKELVESIHEEFKEWQELPPLLPYDELVFKTEYKVTMTHRGTGLTVVKEGKIGRKGVSVSRLMIDARLDVSDLVGALLKARETLTTESVGQNEATVKSE